MDQSLAKVNTLIRDVISVATASLLTYAADWTVVWNYKISLVSINYKDLSVGSYICAAGSSTAWLIKPKPYSSND